MPPEKKTALLAADSKGSKPAVRVPDTKSRKAVSQTLKHRSASNRPC